PNAAAESAICNRQSSTCNTSSPSNLSNPASGDSSEVEPPQQPAAKITPHKPSASNTSNTETERALEACLRLGVPDKDARRACRWDKLRKLREAAAEGRHCIVSFDPQDGPPSRLEHVVDDPGWQATPRDP